MPSNTQISLEINLKHKKNHSFALPIPLEMVCNFIGTLMSPINIAEQIKIHNGVEMVDSKHITHNQRKKFGEVASVNRIINKDKLK